MKRSYFVRLLTVGLLAAVSMQSHAAIIVNGLNMFRDIRGDNNVGIGAGDRIQYGANVQGGSLGVSLSATYPPSGFTDAAQPCGPLAINANFCANAMAFNANRLASPWQFTFTKPGETPLTVTGPNLPTGITNTPPHPTNVTISGSGQNPTISWTMLPGYTPDGFRVTIYDRSTLRPDTPIADIIHASAISPTASSFIIPIALSETNKDGYVINFQVIETRGHVALGNSTANTLVLARSVCWLWD